MAAARVLIVDDDEMVRSLVAHCLQNQGFDTTIAANVPEALQRIISDTYDVLVSDLHMPGAGDGLTVVSAMRHTHPKAVTIILSAAPEMSAAAQALVLQADEILLKPTSLPELVDVIKQRLETGPSQARVVESVATILERSITVTIEDWFQNVQSEKLLMAVPLSWEERCAHLPELFAELVFCLRSSRKLGNKEPFSFGAALHGRLRRQQGYSPAMIVEESRILQVSIFQTLQNNIASIDFGVLLLGVMTIADEVNYQLSQAMTGYATSFVD